MKKLLFILIILTISILTVSAQAQEPLELNEQILIKIGLDSELISQIMEMQQTANQETRKLDLDYGIYTAQLKRMLAEKNVDKAAVKELLGKMAVNRTQSHWIMVENRLDMQKKIGEENYNKYLRIRNRIAKNNAEDKGVEYTNRINEPEIGIAPTTGSRNNGTPGSGK